MVLGQAALCIGGAGECKTHYEEQAYWVGNFQLHFMYETGVNIFFSFFLLSSRLLCDSHSAFGGLIQLLIK
jgi:hypothetical protein